MMITYCLAVRTNHSVTDCTLCKAVHFFRKLFNNAFRTDIVSRLITGELGKGLKETVVI
jgi:hypothetical protein